MKRFFLGLFFSLWTTLAWANVPCTLPFNLQNGTTADATQVMANYNALVTCLGNAAAAGNNNDITALLALITPIPPAKGGTTLFLGGTSTGSANAQVVATTVPSGFTLSAGNCVSFIVGFNNTTATTLNVNAQGATVVDKQTNSGITALVGGELISTHLEIACFDGTQFQLESPGSIATLVSTLASLATPDQLLVGGANVVAFSLGTLSTGTTTLDCGKNPLQYFTNGGSFTLAAPGNDGSCLLLGTNNGSAGTITFSGFTVNGNTGEVLTTANASKFTISIWRINGVASYLIKALQ